MPVKTPRSRPGEPADIERVLEVAARLFAAHGYDGVGIRLIAAESGVTMPTILYHFGSKLSLYEEVLELRYRHYRDMILRAIKPLSDPRQRIECITGTLFDLQMRDQAFMMLMRRDILDVIAHKKRPAFSHEYALFLSMVSSLLSSVLRKPATDQVAFLYVATIVGFCEITAMTAGHDDADGCDAHWYAQKRKELIAAGNQICSIAL